jgi:hypothetical protein
MKNDLNLPESSSGPGQALKPHERLHPRKISRDFPGLVFDRIDIRDIAPGSMSIESLLMPMLNNIKNAYDDAVSDLDIEERPKPGPILSSLTEVAASIQGYEKYGSQCFMLNGRVSEVLFNTSIEGILTTDLKMPYRAFYLGFEDEIPMVIGEEELLLDGTYIHALDGEISLSIIVSPRDPEGHPVLDYRQHLSLKLPVEPGLSVADAILRAIDEGGYDIDPGTGATISEEDKAYAAELGFHLDAVEQTTQSKNAARNNLAFEAVIDAMGVLANSLIMLSYKPDQMQENHDWIGASEDTLYQLAAPSRKGRERGQRMAEREGALPVRYITLTPDAQHELYDEMRSSRGSPSVSYWRKGHHKWQPHGPGNKLRKRIWIEGKLCNEDAELRAEGSLYTVESSSFDDGP